MIKLSLGINVISHSNPFRTADTCMLMRANGFEEASSVMRRTRTPLMTTLLMFILCTTILVGATTAYFTDSVQVSGNVVQSGNLKAEMYWTESLVPDASNEIHWIDASS